MTNDITDINEQGVSSLRMVIRRGYKMSKITAIKAGDETFTISLACGHNIVCYPHSGLTAREMAEYLQHDTIRPYVIGETRVCCRKEHTS